MTEWLYGKHAVSEAIVAGRRRVHRLLLASGRANGGEKASDIEDLAKRGKISIEKVENSRLDALTRVGHHHQGVAAEVSPYTYASISDVLGMCRDAGQNALVIVLDQLQDPQNFGTLLRSAEAVGVTAIVMLDRRQVEVTPAVVNASSGAVEHLHICLANNLPRAIESLQEAGLWVYALQAEASAALYTASDLTGPVGLVVGSEGRGISRLVRERCDGALAIPMNGRVESLNAAVAGSLVLYEVLRQRMARTVQGVAG
ncbi:MAG TPA: 23S rRNA (guanosine(2251)-2'-O)-methyltransferase RlmB [Chloroflexia bacterium]|nr:23S rRNA (guanosine(2251)-2'-O)-methyltransferase RlmB [Chloroflexia bacterium]